MNWAIENAGGIALALTGTISACAAIAALTPSKKDDSFFAKIRKVVDLLALNVRNAKNAD